MLQVTDHLVHTQFSYFLVVSTSHIDPTTFAQASHHNQWMAAMNQELDALELNGAIRCNWVFMKMFNTDGSAER